MKVDNFVRSHFLREIFFFTREDDPVHQLDSSLYDAIDIYCAIPIEKILQRSSIIRRILSRASFTFREYLIYGFNRLLECLILV